MRYTILVAVLLAGACADDGPKEMNGSGVWFSRDKAYCALQVGNDDGWSVVGAIVGDGVSCTLNDICLVFWESGIAPAVCEEMYAQRLAAQGYEYVRTAEH